MKKKIIILTLIMITAIFCSCKSIPKMNEEECAKVAMEYLSEKYGKEFEIIRSKEVHGIGGRPGITDVVFKERYCEDENLIYVANVIPKPKKDKDKDGYYDSYEVESDDYFTYVIYDYVYEEINNMIGNIGVQEKKIDTIEVCQKNKIIGFGAEMNQKEILNGSFYNFTHMCTLILHFDLIIPESESIENIKQSLDEKYHEYFDDDIVWVNFYQYNDEEYNEMIQTGKKGRNYKSESYDVKGEN